MTTKMLKSLLWPYAEYPCPDLVAGREHPGGSRCASCHGTGLAPRFDALRGEHVWDHRLRCWHCDAGVSLWDGPQRPYCLRTDLGSIVRAAAACGLWGSHAEFQPFNPGWPDDPAEWLWVFDSMTPEGSQHSHRGEGLDETTAAVRAFVAAIPLP